MMTTMAALMGALPIAIGHGAGAEARQPLGLAVVGGLILSQILTLYLTPVLYLYLDRLPSVRLSRLRAQHAAAETKPPPPAALPSGVALKRVVSGKTVSVGVDLCVPHRYKPINSIPHHCLHT